MKKIIVIVMILLLVGCSRVPNKIENYFDTIEYEKESIPLYKEGLGESITLYKEGLGEIKIFKFYDENPTIISYFDERFNDEVDFVAYTPESNIIYFKKYDENKRIVDYCNFSLKNMRITDNSNYDCSKEVREIAYEVNSSFQKILKDSNLKVKDFIIYGESNLPQSKSD